MKKIDLVQEFSASEEGRIRVGRISMQEKSGRVRYHCCIASILIIVILCFSFARFRPLSSQFLYKVSSHKK